jgi:hypothetical protein
MYVFKYSIAHPYNQRCNFNYQIQQQTIFIADNYQLYLYFIVNKMSFFAVQHGSPTYSPSVTTARPFAASRYRFISFIGHRNSRLQGERPIELVQTGKRDPCKAQPLNKSMTR